MSLYLIAEIGINHNGDMKIAKELISAAAEAGFDAVKFQKRTIEEVYTQEFLDSPRESPWGTTQGEQKRGLEFGKEEYLEIAAYCKELGIDWSASAWDVPAQQFLQQFDLPFNKVASAMLGHKKLLKEIISEGRKTFISTGMATMEEIDEVVEMFKKGNCPFELMHCNSTYPMKVEDANVNCIPMLRDRYGCDVGYSGHETSLIAVCLPAVVLGASCIERHITLDRAMYGSDQAASVEVHALKKFVATLREVPHIMGSGEKKISEAEEAVRKKLRIDVED
ncbi:N-acetylneuraminate synthase family protein [Terasakiella sp. A23]|uniref:N-acetylneuraminate synthase family protein n=1 Tax=Terasakiella sp. FCG-A23 TaxID=3080561 RepID=UPI002953219B|nr:N-acetylneuraminate synthase family protein [Terasakiella sp. A23]MDV7340798.1 N-acetylneuraminate synthase family protein [Terasakiella sp. A23]